MDQQENNMKQQTNNKGGEQTEQTIRVVNKH